MNDEAAVACRYLPVHYMRVIEEIAPSVAINEIRLRAGRPLTVTSGGRNLVCDVTCTADDIAYTVSRLCQGSLHAFDDTIRNGYIPFEHGYRAGVCGKAVTLNGAVTNVSEITSISIRVPNHITNVCGEMYEYLHKSDFRKSVLIYSPPAVGKTTLLRDIAVKLSTPPVSLRTALIDTRYELYNEKYMRNCLVDVFSGYPKAKGIETATRTMSPEVIVCDEIGTLEEAEAILSVQNSGVPFIASAHASGINELLRRKNIRLLHDGGIFDCYVGISRTSIGKEFRFIFTEREDAAKCI